ncbi:MAG: hypothetical protein IKR56_04120 [Lachnospiraceae bacterium]|nr:hypothetical protein [Lachnospiraceae bacterium]
MSVNLLDYEGFKARILKDASRFYSDADKVEIKSIVKNNGVRLDGLSITENGSNIAPAIYLNRFYDDYKEGRSLDDIIRTVVEMYEQNRAEKCFDVGLFCDFERIKDNLAIRLINYERNKDMLSHTPHRKFVDLAVVYMAVLNHTSYGNASILVNEEVRKLWKVGEDELHAAALAGAMATQRPVIRRLTEYLSSFMGGEYVENEMMVLTNESGLYGASVMVYKDLLKEVSEGLESNLFIIPSSIHEIIVLPAKSLYGAGWLKDMVHSVNETVLAASDVLSDSLYIYKADDDSVTMVD